MIPHVSTNRRLNRFMTFYIDLMIFENWELTMNDEFLQECFQRQWQPETLDIYHRKVIAPKYPCENLDEIKACLNDHYSARVFSYLFHLREKRERSVIAQLFKD